MADGIYRSRIFFSLKNLFKKKTKKIGLALGGGGARGIAHIGVLKVLEENNVPIDLIAGVSSGSLIGGIYASGRSVCEIIDILYKTKWPDIGQVSVSARGLFSSQKIEEFVKKYAKTTDLSRMKIPFSAVAVDILSGEEVMFKKGDLSKAVRASMSFPGVYIPFEYEGKYYVDGCISNILPVRALMEMGADVIIGVDVIPEKVIMDKMPDNGFYIIDRCLDLMFEKIPEESKYKNVDVVIKPCLNKHSSTIDLYQKEYLISLGENAAKKSLPLIKNKI